MLLTTTLSRVWPVFQRHAQYALRLSLCTMATTTTSPPATVAQQRNNEDSAEAKNKGSGLGTATCGSTAVLTAGIDDKLQNVRCSPFGRGGHDAVTIRIRTRRQQQHNQLSVTVDDRVAKRKHGVGAVRCPSVVHAVGTGRVQRVASAQSMQVFQHHGRACHRQWPHPKATSKAKSAAAQNVQELFDAVRHIQKHLGISEKQPDISSSEYANTPTKLASRNTPKAAKRTRRHQRRERYAYQPDSDSTDATPDHHQRPSKRRTRTSK